MVGVFNKKLISILSLSLCTGYLFSQPAVDGFLKGKSNMDVAAGITYESYSQYYQRLNEKTPVGRSSISLSGFAELGLTNFLDIQVSVPYVYTSADFSNLQDFSTYLKGALINHYFSNGSNFRLMLVAGTGFPMSDYETENVNSIGQQAKFVDGRLVAQFASANGVFIMAQGGYTSRMDPVPSSYPFALKFGLARKEYYFDVWYDQQVAIGGNDYGDYKMEIKDNGSTDITFTTLGVSYGKLGATYYKPMGSKKGIALGASYMLWGRNVGQSVGFSASFIYRITLKKDETN